MADAVEVAGVPIGPDTFTLIAGPCAVETEEQTLQAALMAKGAGATLLRGGAYKPRTSPYAFQGLGEEGLRLLARAREETGLPVVTEVMTPEAVPLVERYADCARAMRVVTDATEDRSAAHALVDELTRLCADVEVPTLYVWSTEDVALGRTAAEATAAHVRAPYRFEVLEGVSHWVPEQAPDVLSRLLLEHLRAS